MKLYEIDQRIQALTEGAVDEETGEVVIDLEELKALQMERENKLEGIALVIKNLTADADAIRAEEKKLADRRRVLENKVERLKGWLAWALDGGKLETAKVRVSCTKPGKSAVIDDVDGVQAWYSDMVMREIHGDISHDELTRIHAALQFKHSTTVSKAGVKKLLETYDIPGVHLEDGKPGLRIV